MPGFDGTGPRGLGPMTGGGRGFCTGFMPWLLNMYPPSMQPPYGYPPSYPASTYRYATSPTTMPPTSPYMYGHPLPREEEIRMLEGQIKMLEQQLAEARRRITELK
jgi:hypothetical protein